MPTRSIKSGLAMALVVATAAGCCHGRRNCVNTCGYYPAPLGTISDPVWQQQESNAEASDFVIYEHEWTGNTTDLNHAGMDHVKQIAARAPMVPFPILVEQSSMTVRDDTEYKYPVHNNEELDMSRRELIVQALLDLGVQDAETRVVVSPALTPGFESFEGERAYNFGFGLWGGRGFGGGFGGGGFGGGFGGGGFF
jgi:uncharacterized membrane protein YgcG